MPELVAAGAGALRSQDLLELLLPLAAGAATQALQRLASLPSFAAAALCIFSLVEPSVISAGMFWPHVSCLQSITTLHPVPHTGAAGTRTF